MGALVLGEAVTFRKVMARLVLVLAAMMHKEIAMRSHVWSLLLHSHLR